MPGGDHPDPARDSHLGASGLLATTGANQEEATQLYWLDRYYEAARATGSGIELDPLSKDGGANHTETGVSNGDDVSRNRGVGDDVSRGGRSERVGSDRPMETRVMISDGRGGGLAGQNAVTDGRRTVTRPRGLGLDNQRTGLNARGIPLEGRGVSSDARELVSDARGNGVNAWPGRRPLSESELDRVLVDQALQRNALRGRGVDFGVASVMEEPEEEEDDVSRYAYF